MHLCDYPEVISDYIDDDLVKQVDALKKVVELGRSARNKADLKIRQPLQSLFYVVNDDNLSKFIDDNKSVILDELNVKEIKRVNKSEELITYIVKPNLANIRKNLWKRNTFYRKMLDE